MNRTTGCLLLLLLLLALGRCLLLMRRGSGLRRTAAGAEDQHCVFACAWCFHRAALQQYSVRCVCDNRGKSEVWGLSSARDRLNRLGQLVMHCCMPLQYE
jgi:hypothetical protein